MTSTIEQSDFGPVLSLEGPWTSAVAEQVRSAGIRGLNLNTFKGFTAPDLTFLAEVPEIEYVQLLTHETPDIDPIYRLPNLRGLRLTTARKREGVDFTKLPQLELYAGRWESSADSLFECRRLRHVSLRAYAEPRGEDGRVGLRRFAALASLERLELRMGTVESVEALQDLRQLRSIWLNGLSRLSSLAGIEPLRDLERLRVDACRRLPEITPVRDHPHLSYLGVNNCGPIASLSALVGLPSLEHVSMYESTLVVDGDLSPLLRLPKLRWLQLRERKHYRPSAKEVKHAIEGEAVTGVA